MPQILTVTDSCLEEQFVSAHLTAPYAGAVMRTSSPTLAELLSQNVSCWSYRCPPTEGEARF